MPLSTRSFRTFFLLLLVLIAAAGIAAGIWLWQRSGLPRPGSDRYEEYAEAFQLGVAALDVGKFDTAEDNLDRAVALIPEEPAGWANRGLLHLRNDQFDKAARDLEQARKLAPDNTSIEMLLGILAEKRGPQDQAIKLLRHAVERDPTNVVVRYRIGRMVLSEGGPGSDAEYQKVMEQILKAQPNNVPALLEQAKTAVRLRDAATLHKALAQVKKISESWSADSRKELDKVEKEAGGPLNDDLVLALNQFSNILIREPSYAFTLQLLNPKDTQAGDSLQNFVRLQPLRASPSPPDRAITFTPEPFARDKLAAEIPGKRWDVALPVWLSSTDPPITLVANPQQVVRAEGRKLALPFPGGSAKVSPTRAGIVPLDWNNDYRMDLLLAGAGGLRFFEQQQDGSFKDVTAQTKLPETVLQGDYYGAWAVDIDMDGDMDIILAPRKGQPLLLRNNRDDTFTPRPIFPGIEAPRAFAWADLDNDGAADAALLDAEGKLHVFMNERSGAFVRREGPDLSGKVLALTAGDVNDDGVFDLIVLLRNGALQRLSDRDKRHAWDVAELARLDGLPDQLGVGDGSLAVADLDNNGSLDVLWMGPDQAVVWLSNPQGKLERLPVSLKNKVFGLADFTGAGRLDLLALEGDDRILRLVNKGAKPYRWQEVRPTSTKRADPKAGDGRINSFGIGGEIEIRSGTLIVKQMIKGPVVHFGLGERQRADVIRLQWPNGTFQAEFNQPPDQVVTAPQRLSGSCPFLFTWDGQRMVFVTDFLWSTPLGMYINAQGKGGFLQTTDWVKIRGDQLKPRDGCYDVRINANLWETHYMDYLAMMVVDHPPGTEMHVDERFFLKPSKPEIYLTEKSRPVAQAWDHEGKDATAEVKEIDGVYLDRAGRGLFQGVTRDHWVEVNIGPDAPTEGPVYLLASGFIHPTDSTINFALEQGAHEPPRGLVLEVPDGKGGWKVGKADLGFPAGKHKTIVIRLDGIEGKGVSRHFRLRTNMEIYWDALRYARGLDARVCVRAEPRLVQADLRFRGILEMTQANASSPELPHYDRVISRGQPWRDLTGFHTRFGDVRELLNQIDDRYVIMNAGDELLLRYREQPPHKAGWERDFVWISDGWVKDGNMNTRFGKTVLPLPSHDQTSYERPPGRLEDDPVYRRFPRDWEIYHTRYVTPTLFERGLRTFRRDPIERSPGS